MSLALGKCFGLLSIVSLTGFVALSAGCGDTIIQQIGPGDAGPGGSTTRDAKGSSSSSSGDPNPDPPTKKDAAPPPPIQDDAGSIFPPKGDGGTTPPLPGSCLDTTPINATLFPYTKARVTAGACTAAELTSLSSHFKTVSASGGEVSVATWSAVVSPNCAQCAFSASTGTTTWSPILTANDKLESVNRGGCIEVKSGKESCGRAYQQVTECRLAACLSLCQTQADFSDCLTEGAAIFTGPCKTAYDTLNLECGANLSTYENGCKGTAYTFEGPINVQCITGS